MLARAGRAEHCILARVPLRPYRTLVGAEGEGGPDGERRADVSHPKAARPSSKKCGLMLHCTMALGSHLGRYAPAILKDGHSARDASSG